MGGGFADSGSWRACVSYVWSCIPEAGMFILRITYQEIHCRRKLRASSLLLKPLVCCGEV
jgi:hypothetical protein